MGLDFIELLLELESSFGVMIPDADAQKIRTAGDLVEAVRSRVCRRPGATCLTSHNFYRFRRALMTALPLPRGAIRPDADLAALIPVWQRRRVWGELRAAGLRMPDLQMGPVGCLVVAVLTIAPHVALAFHYRDARLLWLALLFLIPVLIAAQTLAVALPCTTVRSAVLCLPGPRSMDRNPEPGLTDREIAAKVKEIVSYQIGVPTHKIMDHVGFFDDLGVE